MGNSVGPSGFGSSSTAEEVSNGLDLSGKVAIVTGGSSGIGKETVRVLALRKATVCIASRNKKEIDSCAEEIKKLTKNNNVFAIQLDLGDFDSIDSFVDEFKKKNLKVHYLINNAGVMATPKRTTKQKLEYQIGINHFGHFRLTMKILPLMEEPDKGKSARIIQVSSTAHTMGTKDIHFEDINYDGKLKDSYDPWASYAQSKLANIMFAKALHRRLQNDKKNIIVNSLHPGVIQTNLARDVNFVVVGLLTLLSPLFLKSIPQGAATQVYCTLSDKVNSGDYYSDCNVELPIPYANNKEAQDKLWSISEQLTKTSYPFSKSEEEKKEEKKE